VLGLSGAGIGAGLVVPNSIQPTIPPTATRTKSSATSRVGDDAPRARSDGPFGRCF
jgi:hypothetical protein